MECKKSDRLTVAKLNTTSKPSKHDYKSKLMTEKYLLLPINPQQLTPAQTALQRMLEKHPDFEIQAVNTIRPPDIEYTKKSQPLVPVDTPLLVIRKHIPRQSDIDKIVKCIELRVIHGLELPIQSQDLVKAYQTSMHFRDIYHYITDGKLQSGTEAQYIIMKVKSRLELKINVTLPAFLPNKIVKDSRGLVTSSDRTRQDKPNSRDKRAIPLLAIAQGMEAIGGMPIKGINALVDAKIELF